MKKLIWFPFLLTFLALMVCRNESHGQKLEIKGTFDGDASNTKVTATGTGQTTGHIANLGVLNDGATSLLALPQTVYIPSSGQYQPYVGVIPGTTLPPGVITIIPIDGVCVEIHSDPVPNGETMPPVDTWIPVGDPNMTIPDGSINLIPTKPVDKFSPEDIPTLTSSPQFKPGKPGSGAEIIITWPGTDIPVGGTIDPGQDPKSFAPVLVELVSLTEHAVDNEERIDFVVFNTPFSSDPPREREAIIQHIVWIYTAALTGKKYGKENFADKVYTQFHNNTGTKVNALPDVQKEKMEEGIDAFWNTFTAVGVEAKVLQAGESTTITPLIIALNPTESNPNDPPVPIKEEGKKCKCDTMKVTLTVNIGNKSGVYLIPEGVGKQTAIFEKGKSTKKLNKISAVDPKVAKGDKVTLAATVETLKCTCSEGGAKCDGITSPTIKIMQGNSELTNPFNLAKVPDDIDVTVTQTCENDDCQIATCSVTIPVEIRGETDAEKKAREKKEKAEKEKAEKEKKEKEKKEKEKAEKEKKEKEKEKKEKGKKG